MNRLTLMTIVYLILLSFFRLAIPELFAPLQTSSPVLPIVFGTSCSPSVQQNELIGTYKVDRVIYMKASKTATIARRGWTLTLEEKNNFELKRNGEILYGYWRSEVNESGYSLLFQTRGITTLATWRDRKIIFSAPGKMFDTVFKVISFVRRD